MASLAHLSREERLGLGVAAVAHVALVAALVWQVRDDPTALPIPERMTVSLADEVSLVSTSPDPTAEPEAASAPEMVAEPMPEPTRAAIEPRPAVRPIVPPSPRQTRTPPPAQPRREFEEAFRPNADAPTRTTNPGNPAAQFGPAEQADLAQAINRQLKPHWSAPSGVDAERLITVLRWELNPDGSLKGRPSVVSQSGITDSNRPQAALHAERAIRAVQLAAPFDLPEKFYDRWRRIRDWRFDRRL